MSTKGNLSYNTHIAGLILMLCLFAGMMVIDQRQAQASTYEKGDNAPVNVISYTNGSGPGLTITPTPTATPDTTFIDVPENHWAYNYIESLYQGGYVAGCSTEPRMYCPENGMTRAEGAVFVERGIHGAGYLPTEPSHQTFADVPTHEWFFKWAEGLWEDGYTAGCGSEPLIFCPLAGHTRAEAAVFFERMLHGADFVPADPVTQVYDDVPVGGSALWFSKWVMAAYQDGLVHDCEDDANRGDAFYRPYDGLTRAEAACMMGKAKGAPQTIRIVFTPSNEDFANPERGFMKQSSIWPDEPFSTSKIRRKEPSDSVVWVYFRLDNYRDPRDGVGVTLNDYQCQPIDATGLSRIEQTFQTAREKGLKLVYRFIYNWGPGSTKYPDQANPDVPIECVRQHLEQLRPIMIANVDVTVAVQVGFVGHWGEWHSSKYLHPLEIRSEIVNTLLDIVPKERMLQLRYPRYKELFFGGVLSETEAFSQSPQSRVGHHNDCFLRDQDDTTYRSTTNQEPKHHSTYCDGQDPITCWKDFVSQEGRFTPIGGETCQYNPPRTECANALAEMEALHWSFINNGYRQEVLDSWVAGGCMDTIRQRLGYRLVLTEAVMPEAVRPGSSFDLKVSLRNDGFAAMFNERPVYVVLDGAGVRYGVQLENTDPRRWESGQSQTINARLQLPGDLADGTYRLSLWLPDQASTLRDNPSYAVRFANNQVWEVDSGLNILTTNFRVATDAQGFEDPTALGLRVLSE
ncbi:MAG: DUF4832 domain-containing protein [Anaerolineales bacterium]|nr:DUF4832 domain-containing protein [Anaerolineales bacterium]